MKYLVVIVAVAAVGWFGFTRYLATLEPAPVATAPVAVVPPVPPTPPPASVTPAAAPVPVPAAPKATVAAPVLVPVAAAPAPNPNTPIKIDLAQALGPDNHYHDDAVGLSATLPEGWTVRDAIRWGEGHLQNTVFLKPAEVSSATPSMYYKPYTAEEAASITGTGAQALLREQAQKKEASRVMGVPDYQNVPESFLFFDVNGSPAMTYFATFTRGDQVMTEHFIRILGPKGYVMFFTTGKFEDVKAVMPQLKQAASTVKGP
jgi:hypothetical protein